MSKKKCKVPKMPKFKFPQPPKFPEFKKPEMPENMPKLPIMELVDELEKAKFEELMAQIFDPMSYANSLNAMYSKWAEKWLPMLSKKEKKNFKKFVLPYLVQAEDKAKKAKKEAEKAAAAEAPAEEAPAEEAPAEEAAAE